MEIPFGKRAIDALGTPEKRTRYKIQGESFLYLDAHATGRKTYLYIRWHGGKTHFIKIGDASELTPYEARDKAHGLSASIGKEGAAAIVAERHPKPEPEPQAFAFAQAFSEYLSGYLMTKTRRWKESERIFKKYLEPLHAIEFEAIQPGDVKKLHERITKAHGGYMGNHAMRLVRSLYNYTIKERKLYIPNPVMNLEFNQETERARYVEKAEMPAFFEALDTLEPDWQDFFRLALFTGARRGNVASMEWRHVDFIRNVWTVPAESSKNGKPMDIQLDGAALEILKRRQELAPKKAKYVFPSHGKNGHLTEVKGAWKRLIDKAGLKDLRPHDLRRTLGSYQAANNVSLQIIGKSLGHRNQKSTAIYSRISSEPVRVAISQAIGDMLEAAKPKTKEGKK